MSCGISVAALLLIIFRLVSTHPCQVSTAYLQLGHQFCNGHQGDVPTLLLMHAHAWSLLLKRTLSYTRKHKKAQLIDFHFALNSCEQITTHIDKWIPVLALTTWTHHAGGCPRAVLSTAGGGGRPLQHSVGYGTPTGNQRVCVTPRSRWLQSVISCAEVEWS